MSLDLYYYTRQIKMMIKNFASLNNLALGYSRLFDDAKDDESRLKRRHSKKLAQPKTLIFNQF